MKKVLITGGAGFIGSNLALRLLLEGIEVTVLDNLSLQIHGPNPEIDSPLYKSIKGKVRFIKGTVTSKADWLLALSGQDAVIHLAAETGTGQSMYEIYKYIDVNVGGTAYLMDVLANNRHSIKKIIVASSRAVYGEGRYFCVEHTEVFPHERNDDDMKNGNFDCKCPICGREVSLLPTSENSMLHPSSVYGISKLSQEQLVLNVGNSLGIPSIAFRYQNVYGPGQSLSNPYTGILSIFSTQIKNGNCINIFEDGLESRDFVYIDDIIEATYLGLERDDILYEIFNVGADNPVNVLTVAEVLKNAFKSDVEIKITSNYRIGDIRHNYADLNKIRTMLNYQPKISFKEGIKRFVEWVNFQDVKVDKYQESIKEMGKRGLFR